MKLTCTGITRIQLFILLNRNFRFSFSYYLLKFLLFWFCRVCDDFDQWLCWQNNKTHLDYIWITYFILSFIYSYLGSTLCLVYEFYNMQYIIFLLLKISQALYGKAKHLWKKSDLNQFFYFVVFLQFMFFINFSSVRVCFLLTTIIPLPLIYSLNIAYTNQNLSYFSEAHYQFPQNSKFGKISPYCSEW